MQLVVQTARVAHWFAVGVTSPHRRDRHATVGAHVRRRSLLAAVSRRRRRRRRANACRRRLVLCRRQRGAPTAVGVGGDFGTRGDTGMGRAGLQDERTTHTAFTQAPV